MTAGEKAAATRKLNAEKRARREAERREQLEAEKAALRYVRDSAESKPEEILEAVRRLEQLENRR